MPKPKSRGIGAEDLNKLLRKGHESIVARARLKYAEADGFRKYVAGLVGKERVYPSFLPTQASGRWSITDPPLINFPDDAKAEKRGLPALRPCFIPDPGEWWLCWDWDAMHAKFACCAAGDDDDLAAFRDPTLDLHSRTASGMFGLPKGTVLSKGDRRRHLAKTVRYALLNSAPGAKEAWGVMEAKEVEEQGLSLEDLLKAAKLYILAKPKYSQWKKAFAGDAINAGVSRSLYGRPRYLYGPSDQEGWATKAKAAISHFLQGTEVDIMENCLIEIDRKFPESTLVYPSHDGVKIAFPNSTPIDGVLGFVVSLVEAPITIGQYSLPLTATWEIIDEFGQHKAL